MLRFVIASSAPNGSSSSSTSGCGASARAMATRWRIPPESSLRAAGRRIAESSMMPSSSSTRARGVRHGASRRLEAEGDVVGDGLPRVQRVGLEHHPPVGAGPDDRLAVDGDRPVGRPVEPADDVQQRRLAAARGADQTDELAVVDVEVDVVDGADGLAPAPGEVLHEPADRQARWR